MSSADIFKCVIMEFISTVVQYQQSDTSSCLMGLVISRLLFDNADISLIRFLRFRRIQVNNNTEILVLAGMTRLKIFTKSVYLFDMFKLFENLQCHVR